MSSNRKVYARQVPWEWQESPWDDEQLKTDKAALYGNRSYGRYVFDEFEKEFVYRVGEIAEVSDFDDDRWNECAAGIHFFITREEAVKYY